MSDLIARATSPVVISVSELNRLARLAVERGIALMWVAGEISNFKRYDSGHCYFTVKDDSAQVDAVMFRQKAQHLDWVPENGMQVEVRATATVYEARGKFQINVDAMRRAGLGALYAAFEKLKAQLQHEGLFDAALKRELPAYPRTIGVVTSPQAAALRDVLITLRRRMPSIAVIIYPTPVQGVGAHEKIAQAIALAGMRCECDVLIVCRGGGSIEDLWSYNEECVARAIRACPIPVVSGVGHETDVTIADFVADARAATPTAAAEMASPDGVELARQCASLAQSLVRIVQRGIEARMQQVDYLARRLVHPDSRLAQQVLHVQQLQRRLLQSWGRQSADAAWRIRELSQQLRLGAPDIESQLQRQQSLAQRLTRALHEQLRIAQDRTNRLQSDLLHLNPQRVLERGYSITTQLDGTIVRDAEQLADVESLRLTLAQGWAQVKVESTGQ